MNGNKKQHAGAGMQSAPCKAGIAEQSRHEVTADKNRCGKPHDDGFRKRYADLMGRIRDQRGDEQQKKDRMHKGGEDGAADQQLKGRESRETEIVREPLRLAHVDKPCLHPAFVYLFAVACCRTALSGLCL